MKEEPEERAMGQKQTGGKVSVHVAPPEASKASTHAKSRETGPSTSTDKKPAGEYYTPRHIRIPHLAEKIELLYVIPPTMRKQFELARALKVAPATLTQWIRGVPDKEGVRANPGTIPAKHFGAFANTFGLEREVLEMEDFSAFKKTFDSCESGRGAWEKLIRPLQENDTIEIIINDYRRIIDPDEEDAEGLTRISSDAEVMIRVPNQGLPYGVLLQEDTDGWWSMRPNSKSKETEVDDALVYPRQEAIGPKRFAIFQGTGLHLVLAIFTAEPLPGRIIDALLRTPVDVESLNRSVPYFNDLLAVGHEKCRMFSRRFIVYNAPRRKSQPILRPKPKQSMSSRSIKRS